MFKIALVQNTSELRNYSYADLRKELLKMKFEIIDITRDNIEWLSSSLDKNTDCVVFASNSLNDKKIYEYVCKEEFQSKFTNYLNNNGCTLIMHQHALREKANPFPFLGDCVEKLEANVGNSNITLRKGEKGVEQYFVFPNTVTESDIKDKCEKNSALNGSYWMILKAKGSEWNTILTDNFGNPVIAKLQNKKVIFSSLLLDYQKHSELLQNVLVNLIVDNMSLAILESGSPDTLGFSYFLNSLQNKKLYFKRYANKKGSIDELLRNIKLGIHSAILVSDVEGTVLPSEIVEAINKYGVKLIQIDGKNVSNSDSFMVRSVDKSVSLLFSKIELKIQQELAQGFVSDSFMKTIEVLEKLVEFKKQGMAKGEYDNKTLSRVLERVSPHVKEDGSYDKTFGATCKSLWLFNNVLGKNDKLTKASYNYVNNCTNIESLKEKLERFLALSLCESNKEKFVKEKCTPILNDVLENDFAYITEYDFLTILKAALIIKDIKIYTKLFNFIKEHVEDNGEFFNSYVTANAFSYIIDMYNSIEDEALKEKIREVLFNMVVYLRKLNVEALSIEEQLHIICALYKFETVVSFPVNDLTELIYKTGTFPHDYHSFETQINNYQKSRLQMDSIEKENREIKTENKKLGIYKKLFWGAVMLFSVLVYLMGFLFFTISDYGYGGKVFKALFANIKDNWASLFSLLILPLCMFIYEKFFKKKGDK